MRRTFTQTLGWSLMTLLPIMGLGAGCNTFKALQSRNTPQGDPQVIQTSFQNKVTSNQEFNLHMDLGRAHEIQGNAEAAIAEYEQALVVMRQPKKQFGGASFTSAQKAKAHRRIAGALDRVGNFAQAEVHYRTALQESPNDPNIWNDAGYSYYLQSRWSDAERALKTAAVLSPTDTRVQTNLGLTLAASGKTDEAYQALTKVAGPAVAHANLGYILASTGRKTEAKQQYQAALQNSPNYAPFQSALAQLDHQAVAPQPPVAANTAQTAFWEDHNIARASTQTGIPIPKPMNLTLQAN